MQSWMPATEAGGSRLSARIPSLLHGDVFERGTARDVRYRSFLKVEIRNRQVLVASEGRNTSRIQQDLSGSGQTLAGGDLDDPRRLSPPSQHV